MEPLLPELCHASGPAKCSSFTIESTKEKERNNSGGNEKDNYYSVDIYMKHTTSVAGGGNTATVDITVTIQDTRQVYHT